MKIYELPNDIKNHIFTFVRRPQILKTHIINDILQNLSEKDKNDFWLGLNHNMNAIDLLKKYNHNICWLRILNNTNALDIIENNMKYVDSKLAWEYVSKNPGLICIIEKMQDKIDWYWVNTNENAINFLANNPNHIMWHGLIFNKNAIKLLENNLDKIDENIIYNMNACNSIILREYIETNLDKFHINLLIQNKNINKSKIITDYLLNVLNKVDYMILTNPKAAFDSDIVYDYMKENYNTINWEFIFEYDDFLKSMKMVKLIQYIFSTNNIPDKLWKEILKYPDSINIIEIYSLIVANKNNIDYYYLGNNNNIFNNII